MTRWRTLNRSGEQEPDLDTSEAGRTEDVVNADPGLSHRLSHYLGLQAAHHSQRAVAQESLRPVPPGGHGGGHVEILPGVATLLVKTAGRGVVVSTKKVYK